MFKRYLGFLHYPPDTAAAAGGTTDNTAASVTGGSAEPTTSGVSSGTASDAMIKAAMAASSADSATPGADGVTKPAGAAGDTTGQTTTTAGDGATPDAIAQAAKDGSAAATAKPGFIPQERHDAILKNVRRDTAMALQKQYGGLTPERAISAFKIARRIANDPQGFWEELGQSLEQRGMTRRPAEAAKEEVYPEPALRSEDGKEAAYSAGQLKQILEIHAKQVQRTLMGDLRPLVDFYGTETERRNSEGQREQAKNLAGSALNEARSLPYFKENEAAIAETLQAMDPRLRQSIGAIGAMYRAYNLVLAKTVLPGVDKSAEERVRATFARKAATSEGSVHPGGSTGGDGKKPQLDNVTQLAAHMANMAGASV